MKALSRKQVREVDRLAVEKYHTPGIVLMENAARGTADVAAEMLGTPQETRVLILCGGGNNGGDGLAIARHLHNRGYQILVGLCTDPSKYSGDALSNWNIVNTMGVAYIASYHAAFQQIRHPALVIDAVFGTGLTEAPRSPFAEIVAAVESSRSPVLAVDLPSGMDCDTGLPLGPCIRATRTVTFVGLKKGFANPASREYTGPVTVADIGCPREAIDEALRTVR